MQLKANLTGKTMFRRKRENLIEDDQSAIDRDKRRHNLEKVICIVFSALVTAGVIAAAALLSRPHNKGPNTTGQILKRANWICNGELQNKTWVADMCEDLNYTSKPCERFEEYACDAWSNRTKIPYGLDSWNRFEDTGRRILKIIRQMFDSSNIIGLAESKAKLFFDQCMKQDARSKVMDNLRYLKSYLVRLKGTELNDQNNKISEVLPMIHQHGIWSLFKLSVIIHPKDPSKHIVKIEPGTLPFSESLADMDPNRLYLATPRQKNNIKILLSNRKQKVQKEDDLASSRVEKIMDSQMKINKVLLRIFWGMSAKCIWQEKLLYAFEPCKPEVERYANKIQNLAVNISLVSIEMQCLIIDFMLMTFTRNILSKFHSQLLVDGEYYEEKLQQDYNTNHWYHCMLLTNNVFGMATGSMYIRNITSENDKDHEDRFKDVKEILTQIKQAYKSIILNDSWLDNETRKKAVKKLDLMVDKIGYPSEIMNVTYRDELYSKFQIISYTWFYTLTYAMKFAVNEMINNIQKTVDRKRIMNFGGLGTIIGHEIMHAFGKSGSFHDEYGRYKDWLNPSTATKLMKKSKCLADSEITNDEDIADTVGLRAAYHAYQLWKTGNAFDNETINWMKKRNFKEDRLFSVAFSQSFCEKYNSDGLGRLVGTHSPGPFRIKGALGDTAFFMNAFSCTNYSPYVFKNKCNVF
ncbi:hypothetical protein KUTeg_005068 [Tegillarca granosa]|uniref:Endothelin-converting enzyme 1 n=1 Tax=Tegillarca granosa TaxID=220873 RepID=A0ABQ9FIQ5_TEGGR|nr:hypothetical protein KUTeg_005068 [Tegillarca granosa]